MAYYRYAQYLKQANPNTLFDNIHEPGAQCPYSGIYRCEGCGREVTSNGGDPLPPQNHHQHSYAQGRIRWRCVVAHQSDPD